MKWIFVCVGLAMVVIGGAGKYVDITKYKEEFISGNSPFYTIFMTGIITIILGLSFDWILSLDEEDAQGEQAAQPAAAASASPPAPPAAPPPSGEQKA
ncbi:MAG: hypothetical protein FJ272_13780 [Planctomycetes bacterium]|nr:hypothetical protein [Planctomycetota bacterium]